MVIWPFYIYTVGRDLLLQTTNERDNIDVKDYKLVVDVVRSLEDARGSTPREVIDFILSDQFYDVMSERIYFALKRAAAPDFTGKTRVGIVLVVLQLHCSASRQDRAVESTIRKSGALEGAGNGRGVGPEAFSQALFSLQHEEKVWVLPLQEESPIIKETSTQQKALKEASPQVLMLECAHYQMPCLIRDSILSQYN